MAAFKVTCVAENFPYSESGYTNLIKTAHAIFNHTKKLLPERQMRETSYISGSLYHITVQPLKSIIKVKRKYKHILLIAFNV